MLLHRKILLAFSIVLVGGSLSASLGYAAYLRSDYYRHEVEQSVSAYLGLPVDMQKIVALSRTSRQFNGISARLPVRDREIFHCERAVWGVAHVDGRSSNALHLYDGWFLLGTGEFSAADYDAMLRGGLGHDFSELNLSSVWLHHMDVLWRQRDVQLQVEDANGEVVLESDGSGRANISSRYLNGSTVADPIEIQALFTPGAGLRFHRVTLDVPRVPLSSLGLDELLGGRITRGRFSGTVTYRDAEDGPHFLLRGAIDNASLEELTRRLPGGAASGTVDIQLHEAALRPGSLDTLVFSGRLSGIHLGDFSRLFGEPDLTGQLNIRVHQADYRAGHVVHLSASGEATDIPMDVLTGLLGKGVITGQLRVSVNSLLIVNDTVQWAEIDLDAVPPANGAGTIDRSVILYAARRVLDVDLGQWGEYLPEQVPYSRLGCRLVVDRGVLRVHGLHGEDGRTILAVKLLGHDVGILREPDRTFELTDLIAAARRHLSGYDAESFLRWWENKQAQSQTD